MRISRCIAIIALSTVSFANARPLLNDGIVATSDPKIEWTDLMPSSNKNDMDTGSGSYYKEFEYAADQEIRKQTEEEEEGRRATKDYYKPKNNVDLNQEEATELTKEETTTTTSSDKNSNSNSVTKYAFDIIMKPSESEAQEPRSDTTLMDTGTRNAFSKNELASDTTDYANGRDSSNSLPAAASHPQGEHALWPPTIQVNRDKEEIEHGEQEKSTRLDFFDAPLDPYISGIDSNLDSEVYEMPATETTTWKVAKNGDIPDDMSLAAEQIQSAKEEIRIKHDEPIQDQQQIDDLKRQIHHSSTTTLTSWPNPIFSMEVIESGPDQTMYVYKHIPPTPNAFTTQEQGQQPDLGTFATHSPFLRPSNTPNLETDQQETKAEQNVPSAAVISSSTPFYHLVQKQTDEKEEEEDYQAKIKKGSASASEAVDLVIPPHMGDTIFDPSNKLKLPNGSWTPSCKNVSKGLYCLQPDGQGSTIMECAGENVGFQFSCGKNMLCYRTGPFDVDCQKAQDFY